jgi:hypothetical protein
MLQALKLSPCKEASLPQVSTLMGWWRKKEKALSGRKAQIQVSMTLASQDLVSTGCLSLK